MGNQKRFQRTWRSVLLVALGFATQASAYTQALCSPQNTGSDGSDHPNQYQSNGACHDTCAGYSYGIVQADKCWCSNIAPSDTVSVFECSKKCPGYPMDSCGDVDNGLFGYIDLGKAPQGTAAGSSPSSPPPSAPSPTPQESTPSPSPTTVSPTFTPTPSPSVLTVSGSVKTIVVTPSRPPQATTTIAVPNAQANVKPANTGFFSNKGAVAGVFTVVGLLAVAIIGAIIFFLLRRRRQDQEGSERLNSMEEDRNSVVPSTFMSRRTSELGLRTDVPRVGTSDEKTPTSMNMAGTPGTMSRRASMPLTDHRLNPAHLFHDNGSHLSVTSLQDNQDYSRPVLQIANPDRPGSSAIQDD